MNLYPVSVATCVLADSGGLSLLGWAVAIVVFLLLVDFFLQTDIPSIIAYIVLGAAIAAFFPVHVAYRVVIGALICVALVWGHYALWKNYFCSLVNNLVAPDRYRPGSGNLVDRQGLIRDIDGVQMVEVDGDLWRYECSGQLETGDRVVIEGSNRGVLVVSCSI